MTERWQDHSYPIDGPPLAMAKRLSCIFKKEHLGEQAIARGVAHLVGCNIHLVPIATQKGYPINRVNGSKIIAETFPAAKDPEQILLNLGQAGYKMVIGHGLS